MEKNFDESIEVEKILKIPELLWIPEKLIYLGENAPSTVGKGFKGVLFSEKYAPCIKSMKFTVHYINTDC